MEIVADLHTHTIVSGHAYGTIRENAKAAAERGLKILGITEHAPGIPGTCQDIYFSNLAVLPRELYGVQMLYGSEVNVLNDGTLSLEDKILDKLDYAIAGIHTLCYHDEGKAKNTENLISCMKHEKVKLVSHPDDDHTPLDYERLVKAAKEYHVALEVNNSSLIKTDVRWNCQQNYKEMLRLCSLYRVPVVIDSDAHDPFYVGEFGRAIEFLRKEGFDQELVINNDIKKVMDFLEFRVAGTALPDMGI